MTHQTPENRKRRKDGNASFTHIVIQSALDSELKDRQGKFPIIFTTN